MEADWEGQAVRMSGYLALLVCLASPSQSVSDDRISSQSTDGVRVDVRALSDRAIFCITTQAGHKIAAGFGVELSTSVSDRALWMDAIPKIVTNESENYFHLPLRIDLKSKSDIRGRNVHVKLGSCYLTNYCRVYDFNLSVPAYLSESDTGTCGEQASPKS